MTASERLPDIRQPDGESSSRRLSDILGRYLCTDEPGICEARWAALVLGITAVLSALIATWAGRVDGQRTLLDIVAPATMVAVALQLATQLQATRSRLQSMTSRRLLGPIVLVSAAFTTSLPDLMTLDAIPTAPLILGSLLFGALTPGFGLTMLLAASMTAVLPLLHLWGAQGSIDAAGVQTVIRGVAAVAGATCAGLAWRHLHQGQDRARRRVAHLEGITAIVRRFDGSRPAADVLAGVAADLLAATPAAAVIVHLEEAGMLVPVAAAGDGSTGDPSLAPGQPDRGVVEQAAATAVTQPADAATMARWPLNGGIPLRSASIAVPVVHDGLVLAVIELREIPPGALADTRALAELVASAIAGALRAATLDGQRSARLATVERLVRSGHALSATLDRNRIISEACALAAELLDADLSALLLRSPDGAWIVEDGVGLDTATIGFTLHPDEASGATPRTAGGATVDSTPIQIWQRILDTMPEAGRAARALALPIVVDERVVGLMGVARLRPARAFSQADATAAGLLANQLGAALRNAEQHGQAMDLAIHDGLTGLLNRRYFDEALRRACASARRSGEPVSLLVMDLDRFSRVNNDHGHAVGDEVLRRIAAVLQGEIREGDVVARYGGEEFVVIAPGADSDAARLVAERIRVAVAALSGTPIEGFILRVSMSIGAATLDEAGISDGSALFRRADDRLRAAKFAGRNRVIAA